MKPFQLSRSLVRYLKPIIIAGSLIIVMGCSVTPKAVDVGKIEQLSATVKGIESKVDARVDAKVEAKGIEIQSKGAIAILVYGLTKDIIFAIVTIILVRWLFPQKKRK